MKKKVFFCCRFILFFLTLLFFDAGVVMCSRCSVHYSTALSISAQEKKPVKAAVLFPQKKQEKKLKPTRTLCSYVRKRHKSANCAVARFLPPFFCLLCSACGCEFVFFSLLHFFFMLVHLCALYIGCRASWRSNCLCKPSRKTRSSLCGM